LLRFAVTTPVELRLFHPKSATATGVPATGGAGSGHNVVLISEISGPLEFRASLMM